MYLTQITTDIQEIQKNGLFDNYRWKQELCKSLPPGEERSFLFRTTDKGRNGIVTWVLSREYPKALPFGKWDIHKIAENFYRHKKYFFDLMANPTLRRFKKPIDENGKEKMHGKRVGIPLEGHEGWIERKFKDAGCKVDLKFVSIDNYGLQICRHKDSETQHSAVKFCGVIEVGNSEIFQKSVFSGFGSGKAFGFGLLLLKPIDD